MSRGKSKLLPRDISDSLGKIPPNALDLEDAILSGLIAEPKALNDMQFLRPEHFYSDGNKDIYQALVDMHKAGSPIDMLGIVMQLRKYGKLDLVGGPVKVASLAAVASSAANVIYHARVVIEMSIKRELIKVASEIHQEAYEDTTDCFELLEKTKEACERIERINTNRLSYYVAPNIDRMKEGFEKGKKVAESCRIKDIEKIFVWMRGFNQCLTGWANQGKTRFFLYMMVVKAIIDDWKFSIWSPEEIGAYKIGKEMVRDGEIIYDILIHMYTGKVPYREWQDRYGKKQMTLDEYMEASEWVRKHFYVIDTQDDDRPEKIVDSVQRCYDDYGIDAYLIDPAKNIELQNDTTTDRVMERMFKQFERVNLRNDIVGNFVAHPKNIEEEKKRKGRKVDGPYRVVNTSFLLGGSVWENSMDVIYSYHRPLIHDDIKSPYADLYTLKMRDEERGGEKGIYTGMYFDYFRQRYYFNGIDPISGKAMKDYQMGIDFEPIWKKKEEPVKVVPSDDMPF